MKPDKLPDKLPVPIKPGEFRHGSPIPEPVTEKAAKGMTVKQAIEYLSKLRDHSIFLMIDCPNCGQGHQLARIEEAVILSGGRSSHDR